MICSSCKNEVDDFLTEDMICPFCHKNLSADKEYYNTNSGFNEDVLENSENKNVFQLNTLQKKYLPISTISFFFLQILFFIPFINLIFLFLFSFKKNINKNIKNFARSVLVWYALFCTALLALVAVLVVFRYPIDLHFWFTKFKELINNVPDF